MQEDIDRRSVFIRKQIPSSPIPSQPHGTVIKGSYSIVISLHGYQLFVNYFFVISLLIRQNPLAVVL